jgi:CubicO group peptidase (beta-lactamase class C family)
MMPHNQKKPALTDAAAEQLEGLLDSLVSQGRIKHALVAVESGDQSFRWVGAAGDAHPDGTSMREDTPFWIASVTKLYIAAAIVKLHEQGRVELEEPISAYLPPSLIDGLHRLNGADHTDEITVRHLLGHSSGLPDYLEDAPEGEESLMDRLIEHDRSWTTEDAIRIAREELTPRFAPQPLDARRQKISYSDTNYQLLIAIIEAVTGQPLHAVFQEMFYEPLHLEQTFHPGSPAEPDLEPATVWFEDQPLDVPLAMRSFRDLVSTADDTLAFIRALVHGEVFDDPATLEVMKRWGSWNRFGFSLDPAPTSPTWPIQYGLGMVRLHIPRIFSPLRPVPPVIGHTGISGAWLFYCPELDVQLSGTVGQMTAGAVPFRFVPSLLRVLDRGLVIPE